jgi:hypothetical protein
MSRQILHLKLASVGCPPTVAVPWIGAAALPRVPANPMARAAEYAWPRVGDASPHSKSAINFCFRSCRMVVNRHDGTVATKVVRSAKMNVVDVAPIVVPSEIVKTNRMWNVVGGKLSVTKRTKTKNKKKRTKTKKCRDSPAEIVLVVPAAESRECGFPDSSRRDGGRRAKNQQRIRLG